MFANGYLILLLHRTGQNFQAFAKNTARLILTLHFFPQIAPPEKRETENGKCTEKENEAKQREQPFNGNRRETTRVKQQWGES